jgi:hypothetical protein
MRKTVMFLVCFSVMILSSMPHEVEGLTASSSQKSISSYGTIVYPDTDSVKIGRATYASYSYSTTQAVTYFDLMIGHWDAVSSLVAPPKTVDPDFKSIIYANTLLRYSSGANDPSGTFNAFKNNGWLLKNSAGSYVTESGGVAHFVDIGNPEVWSWYANWINGYVTQYNLDGVYLDNTCCDLGAFYYATSTPVNPRTGSAWTDTEVVTAYIGYVNTIKDTLGSDKIVIGNGVYNSYSSHWNNNARQLISQSRIDGIISEGWMGPYTRTYIDESQWVGNINLAVWLQSNLLATRTNGVFLAFCPQVSTNPDVYSAPADEATIRQYTTYCYASLLLAAAEPGNYIFFGTTDAYSQSLFNINVGTPSNSYYQVSGTHVYARDFTNVKVLVNPSTSAYTVTLTGSYTTQDGAPAGSSISIPAHSGIILNKT